MSLLYQEGNSVAAKGLIFFQDFVEQPNVYTNQVDSSDGSASHLHVSNNAGPQALIVITEVGQGHIWVLGKPVQVLGA